MNSTRSAATSSTSTSADTTLTVSSSSSASGSSTVSSLSSPLLVRKPDSAYFTRSVRPSSHQRSSLAPLRRLSASSRRITSSPLWQAMRTLPSIQLMSNASTRPSISPAPAV